MSDQTTSSPPVPVPLDPATDAVIPVPIPVEAPLPSQPLDANLAGPVLDQLSQPPTSTTATVTPVAMGSLNKEGGLPAPTEIPLSSLASAKEAGATANPLEAAGAATGPVETEPAKELEPEVEALQEKIAQHKINAPQETVVRAESLPAVAPVTVAQPVVVLPLTEKGMDSSKSKSPVNSARWLYVWCVRQIRRIKDFLVVYRDE